MNLSSTWLAAVAVLINSVSAFGASSDGLRNVQVGEEVPAFSLSTIDGGRIESSEFNGKVVMLVFIAAQQRSSEGAAASAYTVFRDLRRDDLALLYVTADAAQVSYFRQQRDRTSIHEPLGIDFERKLYGGLGLIVLPTTLVIDKDWKLARVISVYRSDYEHVLRASTEHALGLLSDEQLEQRLTAKSFQRDRPGDRVARHRAAAKSLRENGLLEDAENELGLALEIDDAHADVQTDLASLFIDMERLDEAEEMIERVLGAQAYHRRARLLKGVLLYHRGDLEQASQVLEEVLLLNPDPVQTHYYLGLVYEASGDTAKAMEHYRESLARVLKNRPI